MIDLKEIKKDFDKVIKYSQGIPNPKTDKLLHDWLIAKRPLMDNLLNGEMIYEVPEKVHFHLSPKMRQNKISDFSSELISVYGNLELAYFIEHQYSEDFFDNKVTADYVTKEGKKIPKGMKLVKSFKYFEKDKKVLEYVQNMASMIIQEDKIEGTLCFSVHPLDFLSSSENSYNWRSCHSLDGEYRAGNLSYITDCSTIICYLKTDDKVKLPNFPEDVLWNSKKWRMLLFFPTYCYGAIYPVIFAGRQYPFFSEEALEIVKEKLIINSFNLLYFNSYTKWHNDVYHYFTMEDGEKIPFRSPQILLQGKFYNIGEVVSDAPNSLHFNDLLNSSCYTPYYISHKYVHAEDLKFEIGSPVKCLHCGDNLITNSDIMVCEECAKKEEYLLEGYVSCTCCDRRIREEDAVYTSFGYLCPCCYEEECSTCEKCGQVFFNEDITYNRDYDLYVCESCEKELNNGS